MLSTRMTLKTRPKPSATSEYVLPMTRPFAICCMNCDTSASEVRGADVVVLPHLVARPGPADSAVLQEVGVVGDPQRLPRVLLGHQDRHALVADPADEVEEL